jgi:hypothetical protein
MTCRWGEQSRMASSFMSGYEPVIKPVKRNRRRMWFDYANGSNGPQAIRVKGSWERTVGA